MVVALIVASVVVSVVALLAIADRAFYRSFRRRAARTRAAAGEQPGSPVTEEDLRKLPEPLARYLRFSGVVGNRRISWLRLRHSGQFKPDADRPWAPVKGEYWITTRRPSFTWYGKLRVGPGLTASAIDSYFAGEGRMQVKALSLIPVVDARSPLVNQAAFGRCLAELFAMAPSFALERDLVEAVQTGRDEVRCRVVDGKLEGDAHLFINRDGSLDRVVVMRFYDRGDGQASLERFTGKTSSPRDFAGLTLASRFDGYWNLPEGDLHYVAFTVDRVECDKHSHKERP